MKRYLSKYINTSSNSWRIGFLLILCGVIVAVAENFGVMVRVAGVIDSLSGDMEAAKFIVSGAGMITLRAALPK